MRRDLHHAEIAGEMAEMQIDPARAKVLTTQLSQVVSRVERAATGRAVRLVAVSKLKPVNDILALHRPPYSQLHFGENYQQELLEKSRLLPKKIRWHFIGALQSNKCKPMAEQIPNLWCVESVDSVKKADQLEKGRLALKQADPTAESLRVFVQVNTSGEVEKSGVQPAEAATLCRHILEGCPHLHLQGLMTIGAIARSQAAGDNDDFLGLRQVRDQVQQDLSLAQDRLELSMGMSEDFENAINCGSDEVRVGSTIFGQRPNKQDAKIQEEHVSGQN